MLGVALRAGQLMLENGANTARVEEAISRFGSALGAQRMDVFVTPTGIVVSAIAGEQHRTRVVRVTKTGIDLNRVAAINTLADRVSGGEFDRVRLLDELERIAHAPRLYGFLPTILAVGIACACFSLLFGGGLPEALVAGVASGVGQSLREVLARLGVGRLAMTFLVTVVVSGLTLLGTRALGVPEPGLALAASVLLLVPGVLMVSSIADLFRGDTLSGMARAASAALIVSTVGGGLLLVLLSLGPELGLTVREAPPLLPASVLALAAALGFAVLFDVPLRGLLLGGLAGAAGYALRAVLVLLAPAAPPEAGMFLAGFLIIMVSELGGYLLRLPTSIISIPGFIPLVPGVLAFRAVLALAEQDYAVGTANLVQATLRVAALAAGLGTAQSLTRRRWWPLAGR